MLCGGNIDLMILSSIIQRGLARNGQLVRLRVETRDVPGQLARMSGVIGAAGGNIIEVHHQRAFSAQPLQTALVDFILQTRGREHLAEIMRALKDAGARAVLPEPEIFNGPRSPSDRPPTMSRSRSQAGSGRLCHCLGERARLPGL